MEDCSEQKKSSHKLQTNLAKQEELNEAFKKVVACGLLFIISCN